MGAEIIKASDAANATIGKKDEAVANQLGVRQLMDRQDEGASFDCLGTQQIHNLAGLSEIKAIERFVHEK